MSSGIDWGKVKHFKPAEFVKPEKMDSSLVYQLDDFRSFIGKTIVITSAWATGGHTSNSQHYQGKAVDIVIPTMGLLEAYLEAERWNWGGIGVYPHWHYNGVKVGGLHLDVRAGERAARWWFDIKKNDYADWNADAVRKLIKDGIL